MINISISDSQGGKWPYAEVAGAIEKCGATHVECDVTQTHIDHENKIVSTPAYMYEGEVYEIHDGVTNMIDDLFTLLK